MGRIITTFTEKLSFLSKEYRSEMKKHAPEEKQSIPY